MKSTDLLRVVIKITVTLVLLLLSVSGLAAAPEDPVDYAADPAGIQPGDILLSLPFPDLAGVTWPAGLHDEQAVDLAHGIVNRQAAPLLAELEARRSRGAILGYQLRYDLQAVAVQPATAGLAGLDGLTEVALVSQGGGSGLACGAFAAQALVDQVLTRSRPLPQFSAAGPGADLTIQLYMPPPELTGHYFSSVQGQAPSNTEVEVRITRAGAILTEGTTRSDAGGWFYFEPQWAECPQYGYTWRLMPGDVVQVAAVGQVATTTAAPVLAWIDPVTDVVEGRTAAGRSVRVQVGQFTTDVCNWPSTTVGGVADGAGRFLLDLTSQVDINRAASVQVYSLDAAGHASYYYFYPYHVRLRYGESYIYGYVRPNATVSVSVQRGGSQVASATGRSDGRGYFYAYLSDASYNSFNPQPGDVVRVSGDVTINYTVAQHQMTLDADNNRAIGLTAAGRIVEVDFYSNSGSSPLTNTCEGYGVCGSARAAADGSFVLTSSLDFARGDYAYFYSFDSEGNYQYQGPLYMPAIIAETNSDRVNGFWNRLGTYLTATLKDSAGRIKRAAYNVWTDSYDGEFSFWWQSPLGAAAWDSEPSPAAFSPLMAQGDRIEVSDGTHTESMTIRPFQARLDDDTDRLVVTSEGGAVAARVYDFRRSDSATRSSCTTATASAGTYIVPMGSVQIAAQDSAEVWLRVPEGHYQLIRPHAFTLWFTPGSTWYRGYTETPGATLTETVQRGASSYTRQFTSSGEGWAWLSLAEPLRQDDIIVVKTSDGDEVRLTAPPLTVAVDAPGNQIFGRGAPDDTVWAELRRYLRDGGWYSQVQTTTTDSLGLYRASFAGKLWSYDCSPVATGHRCTQPSAYYYSPEDHSFQLDVLQPAGIGADIYEDDETQGSANAYSGPQTHTLHRNGDLDWVYFDVTQADVQAGRHYTIDMRNLGWDLGVSVGVFAVGDEMNALAWRTFYKSWQSTRGEPIIWQPRVAGRYYVLVQPAYELPGGGYCDAAYDLVIEAHHRVMLPMLMR